MENEHTLIVLATSCVNALIGAIFRAIEKRRLKKKGLLKDEEINKYD